MNLDTVFEFHKLWILDNFRLIIILKFPALFGKRSIINEVFIIFLNFYYLN